MQPQGALGLALGETFGLCLREETKCRAKRGSVSSGNPTAVIIQSVLEANCFLLNKTQTEPPERHSVGKWAALAQVGERPMKLGLLMVTNVLILA